VNATDATLAALLRAVLDEPDEDVHRLVYADRLDELGIDPGRAEFIRVQVEMARVAGVYECQQCRDRREGRAITNGPCRCRPPYLALRRRARDLLDAQPAPGEAPEKNRHAWCWPVYRFALGWSFWRGFLVSVMCPAIAWCRTADRVLVRHPVEGVRLTTDLRFGIIGGRPGLAVFAEDSPGLPREVLHFIEPEPNMPERVNRANGPPYILNRLWPRIRFTLADGRVVAPAGGGAAP
jgi:uncharacterized protein (TIGR02996 family)